LQGDVKVRLLCPGSVIRKMQTFIDDCVDGRRDDVPRNPDDGVRALAVLQNRLLFGRSLGP
jgi:hypothetical protein